MLLQDIIEKVGKIIDMDYDAVNWDDYPLDRCLFEVHFDLLKDPKDYTLNDIQALYKLGLWISDLRFAVVHKDQLGL